MVRRRKVKDLRSEKDLEGYSAESMGTMGVGYKKCEDLTP